MVDIGTRLLLLNNCKYVRAFRDASRVCSLQSAQGRQAQERGRSAQGVLDDREGAENRQAESLQKVQGHKGSHEVSRKTPQRRNVQRAQEVPREKHSLEGN